jgi:hypothetical protein
MGSVLGKSIKFENIISFKSGGFVLRLASCLCVSMPNITWEIIILGHWKDTVTFCFEVANLILLLRFRKLKILRHTLFKVPPWIFWGIIILYSIIWEKTSGVFLMSEYSQCHLFVQTICHSWCEMLRSYSVVAEDWTPCSVVNIHYRR